MRGLVYTYSPHVMLHHAKSLRNLFDSTDLLAYLARTYTRFDLNYYLRGR